MAWQRSGTPLFAQRARETVEWLKREMTTQEGAFAASLDADSEGEEGKFYVWSYEELLEVLGTDDGEYFARHYDVTPHGNFEHHNILNRLAERAHSAADDARLSQLRQSLLAVRELARAAGARRQGAGGLERLDDRCAGQRRRDPGRAVMDRDGAARVRFHRRDR